MSDISGLAQPPPEDDWDATVADAIDPMEVAARLEANGLSDRTVAEKHGGSTVFGLAQQLHSAARTWTSDVDGPARLAGAQWLAAMVRTLVLIASCALGAQSQRAFAAQPDDLMAAGVSAWICGQAAGAVAWYRRGRAEPAEGSRRAVTVGVVCAVIASAVAAVADPTIGHVAFVGAWSVYAVCVGLLLPAARATMLLALLAVPAVVGTAVLVASGPVWACALSAVVGLLIVVVLAAVELHGSGTPRLPGSRDLGAAAVAVPQAALLAFALVIALWRADVGHSFDVVIATMVGAAAADPALVLLRSRLIGWAGGSFRITNAIRGAWMACGATLTVVAAVSGAVAIVAGLLVRGPEVGAVGLAVVFTVVATMSAALVTLGSPGYAALLAVVAAPVVYLIGRGPWQTAAALTLVGVAALVLLRRVSDHRVWA